MQKIIIITGPTGVGKTETVDAIAKKIPCEIINVDMGSFYTPLTIGTAKPDLTKVSVPHHLFNILDEPGKYTVVEFRNKAKKLIEEITSRGNTPIFVGGSVFYIQALFYELPDVEMILDKEKEESLSKKSSLELWQELQNCDPDRAAQIHQHDHYRLVRALSIFYGTGKKPSEYFSQFKPLGIFYMLYLNRDRDEVYDRINKRTKSMLASGWIEEVQALQNSSWENFLIEKKIIGYDEILRYLRNEHSLSSALEYHIARDTRHYAKRQVTYLKKLTKQIQTSLDQETTMWAKQCLVEQINLTLYEHGLYIEHLLHTLGKFI